MRVLLADSDRDFLMSFKKLLEFSSHEVTTVFDGTQALMQIPTGDFDVVVLEQNIPRVSSREIIRLLNEEQIPVIVILEKTVNVGILSDSILANEYLSLPFYPSELVEAIEEIGRLNGDQAGRSAVASAGSAAVASAGSAAVASAGSAAVDRRGSAAVASAGNAAVASAGSAAVDSIVSSGERGAEADREPLAFGEGIEIDPKSWKLCGELRVTNEEIRIIRCLCEGRQIEAKNRGPYINSLNHKLETLNKKTRIRYVMNEGYRLVMNHE